MMVRCHLKHMIEPDKIRFVGFAQIVVFVVAAARKKGGERPDPIRRGGKCICRIVVTGAGDVDPSEGVKALRLAAGEVGLGLFLCEPAHEPLRRIADDQERGSILIDKEPVILADLERKRRRPGRRGSIGPLRSKCRTTGQRGDEDHGGVL